MKHKLIASALVASVTTAALVGAVAAPASAEALPQQTVAADQSLASAKVIGDAGAQPQFWHNVVHAATQAASVVNAAAATYKATAKVVEVTSKVAKSSSESSSSSSESSSSSSGGPVTAPQPLHGVISGDAQFDY